MFDNIIIDNGLKHRVYAYYKLFLYFANFNKNIYVYIFLSQNQIT